MSGPGNSLSDAEPAHRFPTVASALSNLNLSSCHCHYYSAATGAQYVLPHPEPSPTYHPSKGSSEVNNRPGARNIARPFTCQKFLAAAIISSSTRAFRPIQGNTEGCILQTTVKPVAHLWLAQKGQMHAPDSGDLLLEVNQVRYTSTRAYINPELLPSTPI